MREPTFNPSSSSFSTHKRKSKEKNIIERKSRNKLAAHLVLAVRGAVGGVRRVSTAASVTLGTKLSVLADLRMTSADACGRGRLSDPHLRIENVDTSLQIGYM